MVVWCQIVCQLKTNNHQVNSSIKKKLECLKWSAFEVYVRLALAWVIVALGFEIVMLLIELQKELIG
jgi:hypothetical protein